MAEVKDNLIQLEVVYSKLNKALDENINRLNIGATAVENYNKKISVIPSEFQKSLVDIKTKTDAVTQSTKQLEQAEKKIQQERVKELQLQKQREQAIDKYNSQLDKENSKLAAASNAYNKLQAELSKLQFAYQNLAVRKEQGATLTKAEAQQYDYLKNRIQQHDKTLKAVDATMGKYQRNVGNYASGFNPLSNSINQLTREMPAFANSVQTGFMAISNNLPIFFDAITHTKNEITAMKKAGQEVPSLFKQLTSSLLSWGTALSVGVTLLTVYGKEMVNFISTLFGASAAMKELNANQKEFNSSRIEGRKESIKDRTELEKYVKIMRNSNLTDEERNIALKKIRDQFPFYFKGLKDEALLNGDITKNLQSLNLALERRGILNKAQEANIKNKQSLVNLREELRLNETAIINAKKELDAKNAIVQSQGVNRTNRIAQLKAEDYYNSVLEKQIDIKNSILAFEKAIASNKKTEILLAGETIGLEYTEENLRKEKIKDLQELADLQIEQADFLAREFELRKKIYDNSIEANKAIFDDEKNTLTDRLNAYELYMNLKEQLVKAEYVEQNRIIDEEYKNQTESINQAYNDQIKQINKGVIDGAAKRIQAETEKNEAIKALEKKYYIDRSINYEDFEKAQKTIRDEYSKEVELATIERFAKIDKANEAALAKLNALKNRSFDGGTLTKETPLSSFKTYYDAKGKIEEDARLESLNRDLAYNATKLQNLTLSGKTESEEYKKLTTEKIALEMQLQEIKDANQEKEIKKLEELKKLLQDTYSGFIDDFNADSGFGKMLDILGGGLDKFEGDAKAVALTVSEAFQEAFNTISEASQANYDAEYERLEAQKEISMQFAGESTAAKEEIERQYEERRKAIARREAQSKKDNAIFNAVINTAQAVVAALPNIPLSVAIGIIGAAQIAMIASKPIPQFWRGTENAPEGWALTQEKGAEVITDKYGKVKSYGSDKGAQMTYLNRGDKVYNAQKSEAYINKELAKNGIMPMRQSIINNNENNSLSKDDFNNGISKLAKTFKSQQPSSNTQVFLNNKQINTDYYKGKKV